MWYFQEEPFGARHRDYLIANLTALVANILGRDKDDEPFSAIDFIPAYSSHNDSEIPANYDHARAVANDLAYVQALVAAGQIIDLSAEREKRARDNGH